MNRIIVALAFVFGLSSPVFAEQFMVQARITRVDTNTYMEQVRVPQRVCRIVDVPIYGQGPQNVGGAIVGGVIGGVLGNQIGKGSGNDVATGVGAAAGAIIGGRGRDEIVGHRQVEQCDETFTVQMQERVRNYLVHWDWNGYKGKFFSQRPYNVDDAITLNMNINPR